MCSATKLPTIVIVAIDSLRADHLGCYGNAKPTSPEIDRLAEESVIFDTAIAAGIPTMPSFTTICTGLHPYRHGIVSHLSKRRLSEKILFLPQLLQSRGYLTIACDNLVVQGEGRGSWFARGYDHYSGFLYKPFTPQSTQLTDRALSLLQESTEQPLFLFIHYWDPHTPYGPRPPFDTLHYRPGSATIKMEEVRQIHPDYYEAFVGDMKLRYPDDYAYILAQYDGEISQVDQEVGRLLVGLKKVRAWENTIFILLSDHGECFGEGNFYFDHHGLYDATTRISLLMRIPGQTADRVGTLVSSEDILPTICDLVNAERPEYELTGKSLLPAIGDRTREIRSFVVSAESSRQASLAYRTPDWKVILPLVEDLKGEPLPDFYGRPRDPEPLLFDLRSPAGEGQNLGQEHPVQREVLLAKLAQWRKATAQVTGEPDPIQSQGLTLPITSFLKRITDRPECGRPSP